MARILFFLLFAIGVYLIWAQRNCLSARFAETPQRITQALEDNGQSTAVFLFGAGLCNVCPTGERIRRLREEDFLFIFEEEVTDGEIANFMETYQILGTPVRADAQVERYLRIMAKCRLNDQWRRNLIAEFRPDGELFALSEL